MRGGYCMPRCGCNTHRLLTTLGGAAPVNPWWDPQGEGLCVWSAYQPMGAASFAASLLDLSGNGNNAGDPGGANTPDWTALTGWDFDATVPEYLTTAFVPQIDQSQSMIIRFSGVANNGYLAGMQDAVGTRGFYLLPNAPGPFREYRNGNRTQVAGFALIGNVCIAGNQGYYNGAADGAPMAGWGAVPVNSVWIGCRNFGMVDTPITGFIQAMAIYDCTLTAPQVLAVYTAMAAL